MQSNFHSLKRECIPRILVDTLAIFLWIKNVTQSEAPAPESPESDSSPSLAFLLCNVVYPQSLLESSGTGDLCKGLVWWDRQILTQIFDFLLPSICHTLLSPCTAMLLYYFTPTAAGIPFYMETCFPTLSSDNQRLPSSVLKVLGDYLRYRKPVRNGQLCDHRKTHFKKSQSQSFTSNEMIIPSSSCGAVTSPQDALTPMMVGVGRVYKQCEECHSSAFCPHNCWASYMCISTIPLLPPSLPFSIFYHLRQGLAHHSCMCHMYILSMSQLQHLVHPGASPSAFQMIP